MVDLRSTNITWTEKVTKDVAELKTWQQEQFDSQALLEGNVDYFVSKNHAKTQIDKSLVDQLKKLNQKAKSLEDKLINIEVESNLNNV